MGMGFILPFALIFVAIPLESFIHSLRTVLGVIAVGLLRTLVWVLRLTGNLSRFSGRMLINVYDLLIFAPLWIEHMMQSKDSKPKDKTAVDESENPSTYAQGGM